MPGKSSGIAGGAVAVGLPDLCAAKYICVVVVPTVTRSHLFWAVGCSSQLTAALVSLSSLYGDSSVAVTALSAFL